MNIRKHHFQVNKKTVAGTFLLLFLCLCAFGCQKKSDPGSSSIQGYFQMNSREEMYIFQSADKDNGVLKMINISTGDEMSFKYSSRTEVVTFSGESTVVDRLECGELVNVVYSLNDNILNYVHVAKDRWEVDTIGKYLTRQPDMGGIKVEDNYYRLNSYYCIYSNGNKIDMDSIVENDRIKVRGVGNIAYTITVTGGHGTLRLKNGHSYSGGWIEIGKLISKISDGMIIDVPEGEYHVVLTKNGTRGETDINIGRDSENVIDCKELKETKAKTGVVNFNVTPREASIYINGAKLSSNEPVELTHGQYYFVIKADGYETYGGTMILKGAQANVTVNLERAGSGSSSSSASKSSATGGTSNSSRLSNTGSSSSSSSTTDSSAYKQSVLQSIKDKYSIDSLSIWNSLNNNSN